MKTAIDTYDGLRQTFPELKVGLVHGRLRIVYENADGFEIARHDLRLRGPGELLGPRQSGVPMLRFADLEKDLDLLEAARNVAPQLLRDHAGSAERHLDLWLGGRQELLKV